MVDKQVMTFEDLTNVEAQAALTYGTLNIDSPMNKAGSFLIKRRSISEKKEEVTYGQLDQIIVISF